MFLDALRISLTFRISEKCANTFLLKFNNGSYSYRFSFCHVEIEFYYLTNEFHYGPRKQSSKGGGGI